MAENSNPQVLLNGVPVGRAFKLNFVEGTNVTMSIVTSSEGAAITVNSAGGGVGAPTDADYLVGTANATLSNEIVVGTTPQGELGGTWASPTVDATHSGSAHHAQAHSGGDHTDPAAATTAAFADVASAGTGSNPPASDDHRHGMPANPFPTPFALTNDLAATVSADQNDWAPTGFGTADVWLVTPSGANRTITGIQGGADGRMIYLLNVDSTGLRSLILQTASGSSLAANRFDIGVDYTLLPDEGVTLIYDATNSRWRTPNAARSTIGPDADVSIDTAGAGGSAGTIARSGHGHRILSTDDPSGANITIDGAASAASTGAIARAAHGHRMNTGTGVVKDTPLAVSSAGTSGHSPARDDHAHQTPGGIGSNSVGGTQTNSTTNISCATATLPANFCTVGTVLRFTGLYRFNAPAAPPTITVELLVNAAVVESTILTPVASLVRGGIMWGYITIRTLGASGTMSCACGVIGIGSTTANDLPAAVPTTAGTDAIDTTVTRSLELRARMTTAVASSTLDITQGVIEVVMM